MKLSHLKDLLETHPSKQFHLVLPGDSMIPVSFHITEVGHVQKTFIDCGGKVHREQTCQLQAWLGIDTEHRLQAGKMAGVLTQAEAKGVLPSGTDLDVEIEYEDARLSQYPIADHMVTDSAIVLMLASKHTDCLAKGVCLPSLPMVGCGPSGCC